MSKENLTENYVYKFFGNDRYVTNAWYLKSEIDKLLKDNASFNLDAFVEWCFQKVVLTVITADDKSIAIKIFNVLNAGGMQLRSIDIVKSTLMVKLDEKDRKVFKSK